MFRSRAGRSLRGLSVTAAPYVSGRCAIRIVVAAMFVGAASVHAGAAEPSGKSASATTSAQVPTPPAATAQPDASVPGKYDDLALRLLKETTAALHLGKTTLKEVAPEYWIEPAKEQLTWPEALAYADQHLTEGGDKRALFLWHYLGNGSLASRLEDLKLRDTGSSFGTGSGHSRAFYLGVTIKKVPLKFTTIDGKGLGESTMERVEAKATLDFWVSYGSDDSYTKSLVQAGPRFVMPEDLSVLLSDGTLSIKKAVVGGIACESVTFDQNGRLYGFQRGVKSEDGAAEVSIGGNLRGEGGRPFFYARIQATGVARHESLQFTPDLVLCEREIKENSGGKTLSRWRLNPMPYVPWPEDAAVEPAFVVYYPKPGAAAGAAPAAPIYWRPDGHVMPAGWKLPPVTDYPMEPPKNDQADGARVEIWFRYRRKPVRLSTPLIETPDGTQSFGWRHLGQDQEYSDADKAGGPGWTCFTFGYLPQGDGRVPAKVKLTVAYYAIGTEGKAIHMKPDAPLPVELPCGAQVARIVAEAGDQTLVAITFLRARPPGYLGGRFDVAATGKDGREIAATAGTEIEQKGVFIRRSLAGTEIEQKGGGVMIEYRLKIRLADVQEFRAIFTPRREAVFENVSLAPLW